MPSSWCSPKLSRLKRSLKSPFARFFTGDYTARVKSGGDGEDRCPVYCEHPTSRRLYHIRLRPEPDSYRTVCSLIRKGTPNSSMRNGCGVDAHGQPRFPCTCTATDQPRRFLLVFFPSAAFAGDALASCGCPAWPDLFRCFFSVLKPGSPPNFDPLSL